MDAQDRLDVLELHLELADALTRAVAYGSPSPVEEHRADVNRRVLELRRELDPDAEENLQVEDPAEEEDAFEDHADDLPEPPAEGGSTTVLDEVQPTPEHVERADDEDHQEGDLPASEASEVGEPVEDAPEPAQAEDAPADDATEALHDAEDANPAGIDSRGDVGAGRPEVTPERRDANIEAITPVDGQDSKDE